MATTLPVAEEVPVSEARGLGLSNEEKHSLPWAVPDVELATNEGERNQLSSLLEPFQNFELVVRKTINKSEAKVRDFFVYALIPGLAEKFAIIGLQERRKFLNGKLALIYTECFIFNGEEKKKVGVCYYHIPWKKGLEDYDYYSNEWRRIQGGRVDGTGFVLVDEFYSLVCRLTERKSMRSTVSYNATNSQNKMVATIDLNFAKSMSRKSFESLEINFVDLADNAIKYPILMSVLGLSYAQKMY